MKQEYANQILTQSRAGYEKITDDFSRTRGKFWDELSFVVDLIPEKARVLDVGCGNGRFLGVLDDKEISYAGIDFSEGLIAIARDRYQKRPNTTFFVGDALALPFSDHSFETVVSFAVLHHIPSCAYRVQFLREMARVVKPGSLIILTVWNVWHSKPRIILEHAFKKITGRSRLDFGDAFLKFGKEKNARYVHALSQRELSSLAREAGLTIEKMEVIRRPSGEENFLMILKKN